MQALASQFDDFGASPSDSLFENIALDLISHGFSVQRKAMPMDLCEILHYHLSNMPDYKFKSAKVGRHGARRKNARIRNDQIVWINGDSPAGLRWMQWCQDLQTYLNRRLFLGLYSFESHFAHYPPGHFYKRHLDAFKGEANRVLSLVSYLNPNWSESDGGELVIYQDNKDKSGLKVLPEYGTITVFLSEEFEHEVLPAKQDRYSVAGWFRLNQSIAV